VTPAPFKSFALVAGHRQPARVADIAVVGAGPAGLMAAEVLASAGHRVTVYDRMASPARKFLMAGRGGLNLTHSEALETFLSRYSGSAASVVREAIAQFPPSQMIDWAHSLGIETFVGSSGRVFPKAMKASPLLRAWLKRLDALGVTLKTRHTWRGFTDDGGITFEKPDGDTLIVRPDAAILALGGASWPKLGSDGSWVHPFSAAGIPVMPLQASNAGVGVPWSAHMMKHSGTALKRIAITVADDTVRGEAVITRRGLEGGAVYALSPRLREALAGGSASVSIDLRPDETIAGLTVRLGKPRGKMSVANYLRKTVALPPAAIALVREAAGGAPLASEPGALAARLKSVVLPVTSMAGLERAISTAGGVASTAIDRTFRIIARPGTFVAGEMLDWDAPTGGYLLQATFATGAAAGKGALKWIARL
jgi:uncharacterized flavoprotein (TIGR03862 family)